MKTKVLLVLSCILVTSVFFLFVGDPSSKLSSSSSSATDHGRVALPIKRSKELPASLSGGKTRATFPNVHPNEVPRGWDYDTSETDRDSQADILLGEKEDLVGTPERSEVDKVLESLGFTSGPRTYRHDAWTNVTLPVFVTAIKPGQSDDEAVSHFIRRFHDSFPNFLLIIHTILLDDKEFDSVNKSCSDSNWCLVRPFDLDRFPSHVSDLRLNAFRPIILQQVLNEFGAVVWINNDLFFHSSDKMTSTYPPQSSSSSLSTSSSASSSEMTTQANASYHSVSRILRSPLQLVMGAFEEAKNREGILSWTIEQPTSVLTHPKMFEYFKSQQSDFYFHRMIDPSSCLILVNTPRIHRQVMLPWVKCSLTLDCISPIGAQSSGCRFDKKPLYRYSGCHFYDISALNVILGILFDFNEKPYADGEKKYLFFSKEDPSLMLPTPSQPSSQTSSEGEEGRRSLSEGKSITQTVIPSSYSSSNPPSQNSLTMNIGQDSSQSINTRMSTSLKPQSRLIRDVQSKYSSTLFSTSSLLSSSQISPSSQSWKNRRRRSTRRRGKEDR